ncbi:hypothetical protein RFI_17328 [Reticulomyxa filosa]|uniref:C-type lectin domain-containing protein n=1 Tax=Reticulomyxa filosa TaxID=46433 RepID=X6N1Z9_RETFI|nr:hypothetical protein RFI_17328 [Reticulomyxa filosa]|eukprot:ETO19898.1 hypothetical protein RFI_17328 [Reticulomyxa filosa]
MESNYKKPTPNNTIEIAGTFESCMELSSANNYQWDDVSCQNSRHFMCSESIIPFVGNTVRERSTIDGNGDSIHLDISSKFSTHGAVSGWKIFAAQTGMLVLQVWRPNTSKQVYTLIGQNEVTVSSIGMHYFDIDAQERITFQSGDILGWWHTSNGVLNYDADTNLTHTVYRYNVQSQYTNVTKIPFANVTQTYRVYSIAAYYWPEMSLLLDIELSDGNYDMADSSGNNVKVTATYKSGYSSVGNYNPLVDEGGVNIVYGSAQYLTAAVKVSLIRGSVAAWIKFQSANSYDSSTLTPEQTLTDRGLFSWLLGSSSSPIRTIYISQEF